MLQSKGLPGSATNKMAVRDNHNQLDCQGRAKIKRTARECQNQKDCNEVSQSKGMQGMPLSERWPGNDKIKRTAREYHNQKDCQGVP